MQKRRGKSYCSLDASPTLALQPLSLHSSSTLLPLLKVLDRACGVVGGASAPKLMFKFTLKATIKTVLLDRTHCRHNGMVARIISPCHRPVRAGTSCHHLLRSVRLISTPVRVVTQQSASLLGLYPAIVHVNPVLRRSPGHTHAHFSPHDRAEPPRRASQRR